jgi:hypothetical protein
LCSTGYTYQQYTKIKISSHGWNGFLVRDESESADTVLRVQGVGSGGGSGGGSSGGSGGGSSGGSGGGSSGGLGGGGINGPPGVPSAGGSSFLNVNQTLRKTSSANPSTPRRSTTPRFKCIGSWK